jgi:hypothetical protein
MPLHVFRCPVCNSPISQKISTPQNASVEDGLETSQTTK